MTVEYIAEHLFLQEVEATGEIWVVAGRLGKIYALELDSLGYSLPIWSARKRVETFLKNAGFVGARYQPQAFPAEICTRWLTDSSMGINELVINMDGLSTKALVITLEDLKHDVKMTG